MQKTSVNALMIMLAFCAVFAIAAVDTTQVPPMLSMNGTRGLTQTMSAEALGKGRLDAYVQGAWYRQEKAGNSTPGVGDDIVTGTGAFAFGVSDYIDIFATLAGQRITGHTPGLGALSAGVQGMLPLPAASPIKLGAQIYAIGGTSRNQINPNYADGYNYFETRTGYDFAGRIIESLVFGNELNGIRLHLNEGIVTSVQSGKDNLLLLAGGLQSTIYRYFMIGIEANSRTRLDDITIRTDPLWLTPSLTVRSPYFVNFTFGVDISLSSERSNNVAARALEPYRLFGGFAFSVDALANKRRQAAEKEQKDAAEKAEMEKKNQQLKADADSLAKKTSEDSLLQVKQREVEKQRADSLAHVADSLTQKARADSSLLADAKKRLAEEKAKRSDAEKQLLSTGMLVMDAVYFESGKTEISMNSKPYLKIIGKMLAKYPKLQLEVGGHTDNVGKFETNQRLSQARSESVRNYMIAVTPELAGRLSAMGYGPSLPKADNATADGRKQNRRVELKVLNPEVLKEYNQ